MITLRTGLPGAGKTALTIHAVKVQAESESRPVYYSGIDDLKLPWLPLGDISKQVESYVDPEDNSQKFRFTLPPNSIVVIDEAQRIFRPRPTGSPVPPHVAALETHRHGGIDIVMLTQHPMLLDANVRRLVGRHLHAVRVWGMQRATLHEWSECKPRCDESRADSIRHEMAYPKDVFGLYKSAEVHTHKRSVPMRVWLLLLLPLLVVALGWWAWGRMFGPVPASVPKAQEMTAGAIPVKSVPGQAGAVKTASQWIVERIPVIADAPESAPVYQPLASPKVFPYVAGCVAKASACVCYSHQGTRLGGVSAETCERFVRHGAFDPYRAASTARGDGGGERPMLSPEPAPRLRTSAEIAAARQQQ